MADEHDDIDLDEEEEPAAGGFATWVLPFGTSFVALAVGALIGGGIVAMFPRKPTLVEVSKDLTNEEIDALCAPKVDEAVADATTDLEAAETKVRTLEAKVAEKEEEVASLEAEIKKRGAAGAALSKELEEAKRTLALLEGTLEKAISEKETLVVQLRKTEVALEDQVARTELAKEEGLTFKWRSFVGLAQLQVCDKGMRRKMGRCRETVAAALDGEIRASFEHCIRSGQETPSISEAEKGEELPAFAMWLDQDNRVTKGWYVRLCDPSLPEATNFQPVDLQETTEQALGGQ